MEKIFEVFENIISDKKKLNICIASCICLIICLIIIIIASVTRRVDYSKETNRISTHKLEQMENEDKDDVLLVEIESKNPAQELSEEEQKEKEKEEKIADGSNSADSIPEGYETSYYIKVNYGANVVTIFSKNSDGNYTPIKAMICSSGKATPTSGVYKTKDSKHKWGALFGGVWGQYTTQIVGNILFHSVPYLSADPSDLEYWEYDKLGTSASAGCIRLRVCDAKWIYDNVPTGTPVEFYSDSNPGPLGKPTAQKISNNEQNRGWDPTDPRTNNPWNGYVETSYEENENQQNEFIPENDVNHSEPEPEPESQPEQVVQQNFVQQQEQEIKPEEKTTTETFVEEQPTTENNKEQNTTEQQKNDEQNIQEQNEPEITKEDSKEEDNN